MSDFFGKLKSGAEKVAFEAEKLNKSTKAKGELERLKGQLQAQYAKLGETYFKQRAELGTSGPAYDEICQAITDLVSLVDAKNAEIQQINAETFAPEGAPVPPPPTSTVVAPNPVPPAPAPAAGKFCPNCGKQNAPGVKFCPDCGTSL